FSDGRSDDGEASPRECGVARCSHWAMGMKHARTPLSLAIVIALASLPATATVAASPPEGQTAADAAPDGAAPASPGAGARAPRGTLVPRGTTVPARRAA